ncbi:MAG TPA: hypothetical protein VEG30_05025 [Terriglobales bacterium]|nr:hypothetical protein [Terriglobales bacterium]
MSTAPASTIEAARSGDHLPRSFFEDCQRAFEAAAELVGEFDQCFQLGGYGVRLRFAGTALLENMSRAFAPAASASAHVPDLTICLWDSESSGCQPPRPQWREHRSLRGEVEGYNTTRFYTVYEHESGGFTLFDRERNLANVWVPAANRVPYWIKGSPLRTVLYWWMGLHQRQLVHAAAVGNRSGGVLIAGKSGSGKSTTALACLTAGMQYAGDDYVIVDQEPTTCVYNLYNTAKVCANHLHAFPQLRDLIDNPGKLDTEKALIFLSDGAFASRIVSGFPLRSVLVPRVTGLRDTRLKKASPALALAALAPTTMFAHPRGGEQDFKRVGDLVRAIPCYLLECGTDLQQIPLTITALLESSCREPLEAQA